MITRRHRSRRTLTVDQAAALFGTPPKQPTADSLSAVESLPRQWVLEFEDYPPSPNARMHHYRRAASNKRWRAVAALTARMEHVPSMQRVRISAVIIRRALGTADEDNDRARLKPVIDGLVDAGVIPNDRRGYVEWGSVTEERGKAGFRLTIVEVLT